MSVRRRKNKMKNEQIKNNLENIVKYGAGIGLGGAVATYSIYGVSSISSEYDAIANLLIFGLASVGSAFATAGAMIATIKNVEKNEEAEKYGKIKEAEKYSKIE